MPNLLPFLSFVFVTTFTPGPNNILSMSNANKFGYKKTLKFMSGVFVGFVIIMLICSYFNLLLFNLIPRIKFFMGIVGALYMLYLAVKIITSEINLDENRGSEKLNSFFTGLTMQFFNFKVIIYGITVISNFIIPYYKSSTALFLFSVFLASISVLSTSCWALFGVLFKKFLSQYQKPFNVIMGLLLIYCAFSISGISHLFK